ncbi:MAG: response regulator transcription factor [Rikenellaceae bacterium]|jgi:DNA-binding NarL/FixJ family response regulator|nr:response regulator transcription factor [Rikenellaceae bacterium]
MNAPVKILIAEPSAIVRRGLVELLHEVGERRVEVSEVADAQGLRDALVWRRPDVLLVSPTLVGAYHLHQLKKSAAGVTFIALVTSLADQSLTGGFDEVISLYDSDERLTKLLTALVLHTPLEKEQALSSRERDVIVCVAKGLGNKQIAERLSLSTHTITTHRRNIASKLGIHSTAELTIYAIANKLVDIDITQTPNKF